MAGDNKIKVLIVDDIAETRENIRKLLQFEPDIDVVAMARTGREALQLAKETRPNVILMDINMPDMDGIQATRLIVRDLPSAQIVMVSVQQDTDYLRQAMLAGARDFLSKPPSADELINTIRRLGDISRESERKQAAVAVETVSPTGSKRTGVDGKIITVFSPKGGAGCTTVATNLAIALQNENTKVALVDANIQFGSINVFLSLKSKYSLVNIGSQAEDLDENFVQNMLTAHASGIKVLLGPPTPEEAELVVGGQLRKLLEELRRQFNFVIVDLASVLREQELTALEVADRVILIATPEIPSLANTKKFFDLSEKLEYPKEKVLLILNRMDKRWGITPQSIEDSLKHPVKVQIPFDDKTVVTSINNGQPFIGTARNSPLSQGILDLAQKIRDEFAPKEAPQEKKAPTKPRSLFDRR